MIIQADGAKFMTNNVYLALYKGKRDGKGLSVLKDRFFDWLIRKATKGQYSHCEIAVECEINFTDRYSSDIVYDCYSSSVRDGGVRCKRINLNDDKWDLVLLTGVTSEQIEYYYKLTKGRKYDWFGAIGVIFCTPERRDRFFCSEWCANAISYNNEGWRFSPNHLAAIFRRSSM